MSLSSRALSAVAAHPTRIICASPKTGLSGARSAMSSPYLYAEGIIARCIAAVTKPRGGGRREWIRPPPRARCGSKRIRSAVDPASLRTCKCHTQSSGRRTDLPSPQGRRTQINASRSTRRGHFWARVLLNWSGGSDAYVVRHALNGGARAGAIDRRGSSLHA